MRVACFGQKPRAAEVDREHTVPVLDRQVAYLRRASDPSIGYQPVQATEFGYCSFHKLTWHGGITDVAHQRDGRTAQRLNCTDNLFLSGGLLMSTHRDLRLLAPSKSRLCEPHACSRAYAATSTTDQSSHRAHSSNQGLTGAGIGRHNTSAGLGRQGRRAAARSLSGAAPSKPKNSR